MIAYQTQVLLLAAGLTLVAGMSAANPIETACNRSGRDAANVRLCRCIQDVADMTLRPGDQRRAAKMFRDPDLAHKTWLSTSRADDAFWERYEAFSQQAAAFCAPAPPQP